MKQRGGSRVEQRHAVVHFLLGHLNGHGRVGGALLRHADRRRAPPSPAAAASAGSGPPCCCTGLLSCTLKGQMRGAMCSEQEAAGKERKPARMGSGGGGGGSRRQVGLCGTEAAAIAMVSHGISAAGSRELGNKQRAG